MTGAGGKVAKLLLATLILHLLLIQPNHPGAMTWRALLLFPLELPVVIALLLALPKAASRLLRGGLTLWLVGIAVIKAADLAMYIAFARSFNPHADFGLIAAGINLGAGTFGLPIWVATIIAAVAGVVILITLLAATWWALAAWAAIDLPRGAAISAAVCAMLAFGVAVAEAGQALRLWTLPMHPPGAAFTARLSWEKVGRYQAMAADLQAFRQAAQTDPFADGTGLLTRLAGRDVLVIFVESYGRTSFDTALYAETHVPTLRAAQNRLAQVGLEARSGWLTSPIAGGQSWLAHATFASGLQIGDQQRYGSFLASPRQTLWQIGAQAGYRTAAIVPAITMAWPEGQRLGFDTILAAADLGYRGKPFNWVTMPDQFTLARGPSLLPASDQPLLAQIVLISSHAPWVPVPRLLPWDSLGDGTEFNDMATGGESPKDIWRDNDKVRDQYRQAIDYSLQTVMDFVARQGPDAPLVIVLGDHPPAGFVSMIRGRDVPVHLIGPKSALEPLADWGLAPGLIPDASSPVWPMESFRDRFLTSFSSFPVGKVP